MSKRKAQQTSGIIRRTTEANLNGGMRVEERKSSIKQAREERRRQAQWRREREQRRARLRTQLLSIGVVLLFCLLLAGGGYFLMRAGAQDQAQNQSQAQNHPLVDAAYPPVDQVYCDASEQVAVHYHAHLSLYINGQPVQIPANTGIASDCIYWLHTHDTTGVIHIEAPQNQRFTLGQFFDIWKNEFPQLGNGFPSQLDQSTGWTVYVNGQLYHGDFHTLQLQAHQLITLAYNSPGIQPDTVYNWGSL